MLLLENFVYHPIVDCIVFDTVNVHQVVLDSVSEQSSVHLNTAETAFSHLECIEKLLILGFCVVWNEFE